MKILNSFEYSFHFGKFEFKENPGYKHMSYQKVFINLLPPLGIVNPTLFDTLFLEFFVTQTDNCKSQQGLSMCQFITKSLSNLGSLTNKNIGCSS